MDVNLEKIIERLNISVLNKDFLSISNDITEEIDGSENAFNAVEPILKLIENNPNVDFGTPGPLIHFVEKFYKNGYEEKLIDSLDRQPTKHTVWMLNRIINGSDEEKKKYYINILESITSSQNIDEGVMVLAQHFRFLHRM
jgi:hypothetical protein